MYWTFGALRDRALVLEPVVLEEELAVLRRAVERKQRDRKN